MERVLRAIDLPDHDTRVQVGQRFPDLKLIRADGVALSPSGFAQGPLLLVFFRGFW